MAINLIDSHRIDRYEFEVLINKFNFVGYGSQGSEKNPIKNDVEKSKVIICCYFNNIIIFSCQPEETNFISLNPNICNSLLDRKKERDEFYKFFLFLK